MIDILMAVSDTLMSRNEAKEHKDIGRPGGPHLHASHTVQYYDAVTQAVWSLLQEGIRRRQTPSA